MKKDEKKDDALLGGEGEKIAPPASVKKEDTKPTTKKLEGKEALKAEAIAKFPGDIVLQTKYILDHSEQINFIVPLGEGEAQGAYETAQINGYKLTIRKGDMVTIPIQIANLLANKYKIAMKAGSEKRLDQSSKAVQDALG